VVTATDRADSAIPDQLPTAKCYTAEQVSAMTGNAVSAYWLESQARKEAIPARKVGRSWRWTDKDVDALFESCLRLPRQRSRR
jgi:hypothetical protein